MCYVGPQDTGIYGKKLYYSTAPAIRRSRGIKLEIHAVPSGILWLTWDSCVSRGIPVFPVSVQASNLKLSLQCTLLASKANSHDQQILMSFLLIDV